MKEKKPKRVTTRREELRWLHENEELLYAEYRRMWVALEGSVLVGAGITIQEAADAAKANGFAEPFFSNVPSKKLSGVYLIG